MEQKDKMYFNKVTDSVIDHSITCHKQIHLSNKNNLILLRKINQDKLALNKIY